MMPERHRDSGLDLQRVYSQRFQPAEVSAKDAIWREIGRYLQRYVPSSGRVIDIGCDRGHFIRHILAAERWASDLRPMGEFLPAEVRFVQVDGLQLDSAVPVDHFDLAFMSNYLEHLPSGEDVVRQLEVVRRILRPGGRVLVLQPNIRLVGNRYWDFIDHKVALTERSLLEAAAAVGLCKVELVTRFLPYSTKSWLPQHPLLVRAYLACRPAWLLFGKQTLYLGEKVR